jgi:hypothetical protein
LWRKYAEGGGVMKIGIKNDFYCCTECGEYILKGDQFCWNCSTEIEWVGEECCEWKNEGAYYDTDCGHSHFFNTGGVEYNEYKYCTYCGRKIKEVG